MKKSTNQYLTLLIRVSFFIHFINLTMPLKIKQDLSEFEKNFYISFRKKLLEDRLTYQKSIKRGETHFKKSLTDTNKNLKLLDDTFLFDKFKKEINYPVTNS